MLRGLLLVIVAVIPACIGNTQRAARVPHATVPLASGQMMDSPVELSGGLSNGKDLIAPKVGNADDAVEVPQVQARGEVRIRVNNRAEIYGTYEHGFGSTTEVPDKTQAPVGDGDVYGYGVGARVAFPTRTPGFVIGTTLEVMSWNVPYVEYQVCTDCGPVPSNTIIDHGRTSAATLGIGVTPSYKTGRVTYFGGVFVRNHPYTPRKTIDGALDDDGDVQNGPFNVLVHAGMEIELSDAISALVSIHQDVVADPLQYGPGIGIALNAKLGD